MSDSERCFTFLRDNIPAWLDDLQRIASKIEEKQDEIAKVPVVQKVVKKTGSTETLKEGKEALLEQDGADATSPAPEQPHIPNQAERQALANANRKRKTASVLSKASGPNKYRTRTMIVVYYDAEVQKAFETLVRNIGTGRNMLRKGKMAARMEAMSAATQDDDDDDNDQNTDDFDPVLAKLQFRPRAGLGAFRTTRGMGPGGFGSDGGSEAFDAADKALENAQSLCERGAHQSLRDGECRTELDGARKSFDEVVKVAEAEIAKQKEKAERAAGRAKQREEQGRTQNKSGTMAADAKLMPAPTPSSAGGLNGDLKTDTIEVDDNPSDDEDFVMPTLPRNIRLTSRG